MPKRARIRPSIKLIIYLITQKKHTYSDIEHWIYMRYSIDWCGWLVQTGQCEHNFLVSEKFLLLLAVIPIFLWQHHPIYDAIRINPKWIGFFLHSSFSLLVLYGKWWPPTHRNCMTHFLISFFVLILSKDIHQLHITNTIINQPYYLCNFLKFVAVFVVVSCRSHLNQYIA